MKKVLSAIIAAVMLLAVCSLCVSAVLDPVWEIATNCKFYNSDGVEETPGAEGATWGLFPWWSGFNGTQIYDNHGAGMYVTADIDCSSFVVYFGNGDNNCDNKIEIYVDGTLAVTYNPYDPENSQKVNCTDRITVTPGKHTIKVLATGYSGVSTSDYAGMPFNCIIYAGNYEWNEVSGYTFYNQGGQEETPEAFNEGSFTTSWSDGFWWAGFRGTSGHDSPCGNGKGCGQAVQTSEFYGDRFAVFFVNDNTDCNNTLDVYVDGNKIGQVNPSTLTTEYGQGICHQAFYVTPGSHTVKLVSVAYDGWGSAPFNCVFYANGNPNTGDITSIIALIGVIALGGTVIVAKKH